MALLKPTQVTFALIALTFIIGILLYNNPIASLSVTNPSESANAIDFDEDIGVWQLSDTPRTFSVAQPQEQYFAYEGASIRIPLIVSNGATTARVRLFEYDTEIAIMDAVVLLDGSGTSQEFSMIAPNVPQGHEYKDFWVSLQSFDTAGSFLGESTTIITSISGLIGDVNHPPGFLVGVSSLPGQITCHNKIETESTPITNGKKYKATCQNQKDRQFAKDGVRCNSEYVADASYAKDSFGCPTYANVAVGISAKCITPQTRPVVNTPGAGGLQICNRGTIIAKVQSQKPLPSQTCAPVQIDPKATGLLAGCNQKVLEQIKAGKTYTSPITRADQLSTITDPSRIKVGSGVVGERINPITGLVEGITTGDIVGEENVQILPDATSFDSTTIGIIIALIVLGYFLINRR